MFSWAKQTLAHVAGTQEPIYGPSAIRSVAQEAEKTPYTETTRKDLAWQAKESTCVETLTFYFMSESRHLGLAQVIYSNVAGIRTTCQFNSKIFSDDDSKPPLWCSTPVHHQEFSEDKCNFYATDCALELSEDGTSYTIKSATNENCIVNIKVTRTTPGFVAGTDGISLFGTDLTHPWGTMRHAFWPRCRSEGSMTTKDGEVDFTGHAFFVYALQGMKPHHAAARWNFVDFQGPEYSAVMMEFTTPPSYGSTVVNVGAIAKDGEIIIAGTNNTAKHLTTRHDSDNDWPEPETARFTWAGKTKDGQAVEATLEGDLGKRLDRIDVMAEVPGFVKKIVSGASGTKPYIYQYSPRNPALTLNLKIGDKTITDTGLMFQEATFISGE